MALLFGRYRFKPTGANTVGCRDLDFCTLPPGSKLKAEEHCVARLFYPCQPSALSPPTPWVSSWVSASGYAHFPLFFSKGWMYQAAKEALKVFTWTFCSSFWLPVYYNTELVSDEPLPIVIFSHGVGGQRNTYSCICTELASQGFMVVSVEHCDGTASVAKLAGSGDYTWEPSKNQKPADASGKYRWWHGLGDSEKQVEKTNFRVKEYKTVMQVLRDMNEGKCVEGLSISGLSGSDKASGSSLASEFLKGKLDHSRVAVVGHSYGGASVALAVSEHSEFKCGVALDPWWGALPEDCAALSTWKTDSPLLIIGSHAWNTPDINGKMYCNGDRQELLLKAASMGPGAMLTIPKGSNHHSFDDICLLFGSVVMPLLKALNGKNFGTGMSPERSQEINGAAVTQFLRDHLDVSADRGIAPAAKAQPLLSPLPLTAEQVEVYRCIMGDDTHAVRLSA